MSGEIWDFDAAEVGDTAIYGPYKITRSEMLAFNQQWDPLPIHIDKAAANERGLRDITASGQYTLCVKQHFVNQTPWCPYVIGAMGFDEVRFPHPVYADDELSCSIECVDKRVSRSKPDRGIVKFAFRVYNQHDETVLSYIDTVMLQRSNQTQPGG